MSISRRIGLLLGPALFVILLVVPPPAGMPIGAMHAAAVAAWVATWWVTQALPLWATSLLPLVLFPVTGVLPIREATEDYGNPIIFMMMGGFLLALGMQQSGLHRRIALGLMRLSGTSPARLVLGFMLGTALISMWVSNPATTSLMLPMALAVIGQQGSEQGQDSLAPPLLLGIAFAATFGGMGTLVGTPPNLIFAGAAEKLLGVRIGFAEWMLLGVPVALVGTFASWLLLTRVVYRLPTREPEGGAKPIQEAWAKLGAMTPAEKAMGMVFLTVALAWVTQPWLIAPWLPAVDDTVIAVVGGLVLFLIPSGQGDGSALLSKDSVFKLPWDILLLFGGGLAIANSFEVSGLGAWLSHALGGLGWLPPIILLLGVVARIGLVTDLVSNTAIATIFMPVAFALGRAVDFPPLVLMAAVNLAAQSAFLLPVSTPSNAIVFGTGKVTIRQMVKAGIWLNIGTILVFTAVAYWVVPAVLK